MKWTVLLLGLAACASEVPRRDIDRCEQGLADGVDSDTRSQGSACRSIAIHLAQDNKQKNAIPFARKACELQDARGCEQFLLFVRTTPNMTDDDLRAARSLGEKACYGGVITDGPDLTPLICQRLGTLYLEVEPKSRRDAGRFYARGCNLGDQASCKRARSMGVDPASEKETAARPKPTAPPPPPPPPPPTTVAMPPPPPPPPPKPPPAVVCHEMRQCVSLALTSHTVHDMTGTLTNKCDRKVKCKWCPAQGQMVNKSACGSTTLEMNESKGGDSNGLAYQDKGDSLAYDCVDVNDDMGCLSL